ncbi:hypothetical protein [Neorhizobium sp. DAR64872/K0K18]|uniref:hypothetical protein n=1 Tax=Neorhizobium sp. DAR64872/K0K18 TaxID=3421958 RepID=UPI003D275CF5
MMLVTDGDRDVGRWQARQHGTAVRGVAAALRDLGASMLADGVCGVRHMARFG